MKKTKKKEAITLLALVITIIILLLLAGVAIQMSFGENGLIVKSVQAQKEQAKAELYDTAKLSYANLNAKALENGQPSPGAELALSTTEFIEKYDIVGNDITDKKGIVIDTKDNVLNDIMGMSLGSVPSTQTSGGSSTPGESAPLWPKTVAGVIIPEEDKDKMILKLKVRNRMELIMIGISELMGSNPIEIEYDTGEKERIEDLYYPMPQKIYGPGEHIVKIKNISDIEIGDYGKDYDIEILQWGKIAEKNEENHIIIHNVSKIYEPEPDKIPITYMHGKFTEIPEWLFDKKVRSTVMSTFEYCKGLTSIPEGLFKNNVNVKDFKNTFNDCTGLTSIPEGLFKNNVNAISFEQAFVYCQGLTSIPEGLFKNNVNVTNFGGTFAGCKGLTSIPEGLFKNNANTISFYITFGSCEGLTSIPEGLFKYNTNATNFEQAFTACESLTSIPKKLFKYNTNANNFKGTFRYCSRLTNIPDEIIEYAKQVEQRGGNVRGIFHDCTSASNYDSLPSYMKKDIF